MFKLFKNKYDILEDYVSSLQKEKTPSLKKAKGDRELESVLKTAKELKVLLTPERARNVQPLKLTKELRGRGWFWLWAPVVTTAVIIIGIIIWPKKQVPLDYSQEMTELVALEQELETNLKTLEQDLVALEEYLTEEEVNKIYQDIETMKL